MRIGILFAAGLCYLAFFAAFLYLIGFVAGFEALPTHVDRGLAAPAGVAVFIDLALIALFGLQHSAMARPGFKARWTRVVPPPLERAIYCLASALCLVALFAFWHPIAGTVWSVDDPALLARINLLIGECLRDPFSGIGKPEPLKRNLAGWWSRRINREHRLVYRMRGTGEAQVLEVLSEEPAAHEGIPAWSRLTGNELIGTLREEGRARFYIRKK